MTVEHVSFAPQKQRHQEKNKGLFIIKMMGGFMGYFFLPSTHLKRRRKWGGGRSNSRHALHCLVAGCQVTQPRSHLPSSAEWGENTTKQL